MILFGQASELNLPMPISRLVLLLSIFVTACSAPVRAVTDYIQFKRGSTQSVVAKTQLNPAFKYLLVTLKGKSFLMARGAIEPSKDGAIEVWYSGSREVLRIQNGRIISAAGTPIEWSGVRLSQHPAWDSVDRPLKIERRRDVTPGYQVGLEDSLTVQPISQPTNSDFYGPIPRNLRWFIEDSTGTAALPSSRYAVSADNEVVYSEQCLSSSFCFSWQRWPTKF